MTLPAEIPAERGVNSGQSYNSELKAMISISCFVWRIKNIGKTTNVLFLRISRSLTTQFQGYRKVGDSCKDGHKNHLLGADKTVYMRIWALRCNFDFWPLTFKTSFLVKNCLQAFRSIYLYP